MKSISGFWSGTYFYPEPHVPDVHFDCELRQSGGAISGEITESHAPGQMLMASLQGELNGQAIRFIKTYQTAEPNFLWDISYSGQVSPKKDHIAGTWRVGMRSGSFEMHRDAGQLREAGVREAAEDKFIKAPL
jgi:hypothetical protein